MPTDFSTQLIDEELAGLDRLESRGFTPIARVAGLGSAVAEGGGGQRRRCHLAVRGVARMEEDLGAAVAADGRDRLYEDAASAELWKAVFATMRRAVSASSCRSSSVG
jgi:hypothetical protein